MLDSLPSPQSIRRQKGMVIILCVCVSACSHKFGKTTKIGDSNELLANFKLYKEQN